jgi:hypothetical protein
MAMTIMARKNTPDLEAILVGCTDDDLMLLAVSSGFKWRFLRLEKPKPKPAPSSQGWHCVTLFEPDTQAVTKYKPGIGEGPEQERSTCRGRRQSKG